MGRIVIPNRQPKAPARAAIGNTPASFLWLPSVSNEDLARRSPLITTGTVSRGIIDSIPAIAGEFVSRTDNSNRLSWDKKVDPSVFTVVFHGYLVTPTGSGAAFVFGQFQPNSTDTPSIAQYSWGLYEGNAADGIILLVADNSTNAQVQSGTWLSQTPARVAASFNRGTLKISTNGGAVVSATASFSTIKSTWSIQSGGHWSSANVAYNPLVRTLLAATFDGYAADDGMLRKLSENPYRIFRRRERTVFAQSAGSDVDLTATTGSVTVTGQTPTITLPVSLTSITGSVVVTGQTPTVTNPLDLTATTGSVDIAGNVPTVNTGASVIMTPTTGDVTFSGQTPSFTLPVSLTPTSGDVSISGNTPTFDADIAITPTTGNLAISGNVPVISLDIVSTPLTGEIIISGNAPTLSLSVSLTSVSGSIVMAGNVPTMTGAINLSDLSFLRQMVFARITEQRQFARTTAPRPFVRRL